MQNEIIIDKHNCTMQSENKSEKTRKEECYILRYAGQL